MRLPEDVAVLVARKLKYNVRAGTAVAYELALPVALDCVNIQLMLDKYDWYKRILGARR